MLDVTLNGVNIYSTMDLIFLYNLLNMIKLYVAKLPIQNTILVQNYNEFQPKNDSNSDIRICDLAVFFPVPFK